MENRTFAGGMYYNLPRDNAPNWVKGKMSFKVEDAIKFLKANVNSEGYVNVDLTESKNGKGCAFLNTYQKQSSGNNSGGDNRSGSSGGSGGFMSGDSDRF